MKDSLEEVIGLCLKKDSCGLRDIRPAFSLISHENFTLDDVPRLRGFIDQLGTLMGARLVVSGGHWGCSNLMFRIEGGSAEDFERRVNALLQIPAIQAAHRVTFHFVSLPYERENGTGGTVVLPLSQLPSLERLDIHVGDRTSVTQIAGGDIHVEPRIAAEIEDRMNEIEDQARRDREISTPDLKIIASELDKLRAELASKKPKKSVLDQVSGVLGKFAAIVKSVKTLGAVLAPFFT